MNSDAWKALPIVASHATGNANVREAMRGLEDAGLLREFHTSIAWREDAWWARAVPGSLRGEFRRRSFPGVVPEHVVAHPVRELMRLMAMRMPNAPRSWRSVDGVYQALDRAVASVVRTSEELGGVYAYEDGAEWSFRAAESMGLKRVYDLPIGYWRVYHELMREERELRPAWAATLGGLHDGPAKLARKDAELGLADSILVASSFTASTLNAYPGGLRVPVYKAVYGAPALGPIRIGANVDAPLRVLYVGSIGQRKGVSYLLEAVAKLAVPYQLTMLGRPVARIAELEDAFRKHTWIESAPHSEVLRLMREHDVLVFPSLFEGFGLVILEAMAQGCVVIATPHTAGPDIFEDGKDGVIVPIRDADRIAAALTRFAEDRAYLAEMQAAAQRKAAAWTWESYRRDVVTAVMRTLG